MQGASERDVDRGTAAEDMEETEDDLLPQTLLLGDLDITSQDISLKGASMHLAYSHLPVLTQKRRARSVGLISLQHITGQAARAPQTI